MTHIQQHPSLPRRLDCPDQLAVHVHDALIVTRAAVTEDVAWPEAIDDPLDRGWHRTDVHHDRHVVPVCDLARVLEVGLRSRTGHVPTAECLQTDDHIAILLYRPLDRATVGLQGVARVLSLVPASRLPIDLDKGKHPTGELVDDKAAKTRKAVASGGARIDLGAHGALGCLHVRIDRDGTMPPVDVGMEVDEAGGDQDAPCVDDLARLVLGQTGFDGDDLLPNHCHVQSAAQALAGVQHLATLDQKVVHRGPSLERLSG